MGGAGRSACSPSRNNDGIRLTLTPTGDAMSLLLLPLLPYVLWLFYLAVMNLERAQKAGTLSPIATLLGKPILFVGYALDVALNLTFFSLLVADVPREWTI